MPSRRRLSAVAALVAAVVLPAGAASAPLSRLSVSISGQAVQGRVMTAVVSASSSSTTSYVFQWKDCNSSGYGCVVVPGATSSSDLLTSTDVGHTVRVAVTIPSGRRASTVTSAPTGVVQASTVSDTTPPSVPQGQTVSSTASTIVMDWQPSTDNVGVTGYDVYLNGSAVGTTTATSYTYKGLTCGTSYTVALDAYDAAGNHSDTAYATATISTTACSDTTAPSVPSGLGTSAVSQTGATLSWSASTDNVGVTGYRIYLNGAQVTTTTATSYAYTGLSCGISYTLGVAAYDAAGNLSTTATTTTQTSACSGAVSSGSGFAVYVATTGSDSTCVRGDASHPCATFAKACSLAQPGETVGIAPGTYAPQSMSRSDCPNASSSAQITFEPTSASAPPSAGAAADAPVIGGTCSNNCGGLTLEGGTGFFWNNVTDSQASGTGTNAPNYVTFYNLNIQGRFEAAGDQGPTGSGTSGIGIVLDHVSTGAFNDPGLTNFVLENSNIGPCYNPGDSWGANEPCLQENSNDFSEGGAAGGRQQTSGTFDHDVFHDYHNKNSTADHSECYFALDWRVLTITDSSFYNCEISGGIRIERIIDPPSGSLLTIQNNWFGFMYDHDGAGRRCSGVDWGSNSGALSNVLIRYNSFADGTGLLGTSGSPTATFRMIGNLVGLDPTNANTCEASPVSANYGSASIDSNVWVGHDLGTNSAHVTTDTAFNALFVNPGGGSSGDYHLTGGPYPWEHEITSTSSDQALATDHDNNTRSVPRTPGADQR